MALSSKDRVCALRTRAPVADLVYMNDFGLCATFGISSPLAVPCRSTVAGYHHPPKAVNYFDRGGVCFVFVARIDRLFD